jgi:hypothetical protein
MEVVTQIMALIQLYRSNAGAGGGDGGGSGAAWAPMDEDGEGGEGGRAAGEEGLGEDEGELGWEEKGPEYHPAVVGYKERFKVCCVRVRPCVCASVYECVRV